jgi:hypothetical protein
MVTVIPTGIMTWSVVRVVGGAEPPHVAAALQLPEVTAVNVVALTVVELNSTRASDAIGMMSLVPVLIVI